MKNVHIYQPSKTAMQSGRGKVQDWVLEYDSEPHRRPDPLMGWTSADDTLCQVKLEFDSMESAVEYAKGKGWAYKVSKPRKRRVKPRNYGDNFKYRPPVEDE